MPSPIKLLNRMPIEADAHTWGPREKLLHLRHIAEELRDINADLQMDYWFTSSNINECGTAACMGGYACYDPTFRSLGLEIEDGVIPLFRLPSGGGHYSLTGLIALDGFFGVETWCIFSPYAYTMEYQRLLTRNTSLHIGVMVEPIIRRRMLSKKPNVTFDSVIEHIDLVTTYIDLENDLKDKDKDKE